jgi:hypothetical protein
MHVPDSQQQPERRDSLRNVFLDNLYDSLILLLCLILMIFSFPVYSVSCYSTKTYQLGEPRRCWSCSQSRPMWYYSSLNRRLRTTSSRCSFLGANYFFIAVSEVEAVNAIGTGKFVMGSVQDLYASALLASR